MIEINLLPPQYKRRVNILAYLGDLLPYLGLILGVLLFFNLFLGFFIAKGVVAQKRAEYLWLQQQPNYKEISTLKEEINRLKTEYSNLSKLTGPEVPFSEIMHVLYKILPPNIWFKEINFDGSVLAMKGVALDFEEDAPLALKRYVEELRESNVNSDFPGVRIAFQEMAKIKDKNVLYFEVELNDEAE